jgi:hypothetical protein
MSQASITRQEAEGLVRKILANKRGTQEFAPKLFRDSVNQLLIEINGSTDEPTLEEASNGNS